ncbi:MAG: amino acid permease [Deltaproteobacteria bacterium]|nr:amino acid permease [Deltaproteobacteria bacterium]
MAKEGVVFARKASGLTREAGLLDTTYFGIMNNAVPISIWFVLMAFYWLPGASLTLACLLALAMVVFGFASVWGILGGSMPRSGGSYVYNSRIIHPVIGLGVSFANAGFVMLSWIWVLAPWVGEVGFPIMAGCLGIPLESVEPFTSGWGLYAVATIVNVTAFVVVMSGMRTYFRIQKIFVTWSLIGAAIAGIIITATSNKEFVQVWNNLAAKMGSLDWNTTVAAATKEIGEIPDTWNWKSTIGMMLPVSWVAIYGYIITFIGGEIKSPRKNIFTAQILNAVICIGFLLWVGLAFKSMTGWKGLHAISFLSDTENTLNGYTFPFHTTYINVASMLVNFNVVLGIIMAGAFMVADWLWIAFSYIAWSRAAFAWGMDGLGPKWFTDISPKYGQPVKLLLAMFIAAQIALTEYAFNPEVLASISVEVVQLGSVFGVTCLACLIFPYVGKTSHIWNASPYKNWRIAGIPYATIAGIIGLALVVMMVYAYYITEEFAFMHNIWTLIYGIVWAIGITWYFVWKNKRAKEGIDVTLAFTEIPPE